MRKHGHDSLHSWFVAAGLTFVSTVLYAVVRLSGVLFVASMDRFGADRKSASLPYILTDFIQAISSPLTGFLASKFGVRLVMIVGCFISSVGIASCFFAQTIETVTVCWGVILGIGSGLSIPLLALVITQHFVEKRAIALGIVYSGTYVGYGVLPSIAEHSIEYFGLLGTFLLISGLMLNCIPIALLILKPLSTENNLKNESRTRGNKSKSITDTSSQEAPSNDKAKSKGAVNKGFEVESNLKCDRTNTLERSPVNGCSNVTNCQDIGKYSNELPSNGPLFIYEETNESNSTEILSSALETNLSEKSTSRVLHSPAKKDASSMKAFKVFLEPVYIVILLIEAMYEGSFIAFVTILVDFSLDVGVTFSDTNYVILVFSIASNVGLVSFGWVTDNGHLSLTNFGALLLVLRCATSAFIPFSKSLPVLLIAVALHGFCEAPVANLLPLIIAEYYIPEVHEVAISCRLFFCAPVYLITPTLIGYFRDGLGSYLYLFLMISASSFVCGVLSFFIPQLSKCRCRRDDESILKRKVMPDS